MRMARTSNVHHCFIFSVVMSKKYKIYNKLFFRIFKVRNFFRHAVIEIQKMHCLICCTISVFFFQDKEQLFILIL